MKSFIAFIIKEYYHIIRDKRSLLILLGMPIVQIILFGYGITNEINDANIAILDNSKDNITKEISNKLLSTKYFKLKRYLDSEREIEKSFKSGEIKQVLVFEPHFAENLQKFGSASIHLITDGTDPNIGNTIMNYTNSIILNYQSEMNVNLAGIINVLPEVKMRYNPELKGVYLFVPGLITIILNLISAMMTSISIAREKEMGTMEVLLVSPMKPIFVIVAKLIPYSLISFSITIIILILGGTIFNVPITGSLGFLLLECILYLFLGLSMGILISTIAPTQQVAMFISMIGLMLPTILLSGFIIPIENMPYWLQILSNIIPAKWFIIIIKDIMLKGSGITFVWKETLIIVLMITFLLIVSAKKYKIRLQ
ncbi:MAG: multidrug ABC transporter permease [Ignavibacteria bacterium GWF2_33_9]|nr:MAG: multidrug ABC transporter permease [Ignavibacteria bacterium GWF2_33_9]